MMIFPRTDIHKKNAANFTEGSFGIASGSAKYAEEKLCYLNFEPGANMLYMALPQITIRFV